MLIYRAGFPHVEIVLVEISETWSDVCSYRLSSQQNRNPFLLSHRSSWVLVFQGEGKGRRRNNQDGWGCCLGEPSQTRRAKPCKVYCHMRDCDLVDVSIWYVQDTTGPPWVGFHFSACVKARHIQTG